MENWRALMGWHSFFLISRLVFIIASVSFVAVLCLWRPSFLPVLDSIQRFTATLLSFSSLVGVVILSQLLWFGWQTRATLHSAPRLHPRQIVSTNAVPRTRVIWILLDELSYQQVYEQRFPGLQLPAFDQLAAQSTVFTHTIPTSNSTETAVPSLITGSSIDRLRVSVDGQLRSLHNSVSGAWQPFDPHQTVFQDALNRGYSTGIAGWFNPYCRILSQVLDQCFWVVRPPWSVTLRQLISQAWSVLLRRLLPNGAIDLDNVENHIADYRDLLSAGDRLLADPSSDFIFLHMPIPHPGGIYDRKRGSFTTRHSSYIDNLALADQYLSHVRRLLEQHGQWDSSVVIVMGDHSWRTLTWSSSPEWTAEEQLASHGGQFDDRPAYIVKLPYQQNAAHIDTPFAATHTRALLDAIMGNQIRSLADLQNWVQQQR